MSHQSWSVFFIIVIAMTTFVLNKDICTCSIDNSNCNSSSDFDAIYQKMQSKNHCRKTFSLDSPLTSFIDCAPDFKETKSNIKFYSSYDAIYDLLMLTSTDGSENTLTIHCRELGKCFKMDYNILLNYLQLLATTLNNLITPSTSNLTCNVPNTCKTDEQQTFCTVIKEEPTFPIRCDRSKLVNGKNVIRHEVVWLNRKSSTTMTSILCRDSQYCNRELINMNVLAGRKDPICYCTIVGSQCQYGFQMLKHPFKSCQNILNLKWRRKSDMYLKNFTLNYNEISTNENYMFFLLSKHSLSLSYKCTCSNINCEDDCNIFKWCSNNYVRSPNIDWFKKSVQNHLSCACNSKTRRCFDNNCCTVNCETCIKIGDQYTCDSTLRRFLFVLKNFDSSSGNIESISCRFANDCNTFSFNEFKKYLCPWFGITSANFWLHFSQRSPNPAGSSLLICDCNEGRFCSNGKCSLITDKLGFCYHTLVKFAGRPDLGMYRSSGCSVIKDNRKVFDRRRVIHVFENIRIVVQWECRLENCMKITNDEAACSENVTHETVRSRLQIQENITVNTCVCNKTGMMKGMKELCIGGLCSKTDILKNYGYLSHWTFYCSRFGENIYGCYFDKPNVERLLYIDVLEAFDGSESRRILCATWDKCNLFVPKLLESNESEVCNNTKRLQKFVTEFVDEQKVITESDEWKIFGPVIAIVTIFLSFVILAVCLYITITTLRKKRKEIKEESVKSTNKSLAISIAKKSVSLKQFRDHKAKVNLATRSSKDNESATRKKQYIKKPSKSTNTKSTKGSMRSTTEVSRFNANDFLVPPTIEMLPNKVAAPTKVTTGKQTQKISTPSAKLVIPSSENQKISTSSMKMPSPSAKLTIPLSTKISTVSAKISSSSTPSTKIYSPSLKIRLQSRKVSSSPNAPNKVVPVSKNAVTVPKKVGAKSAKKQTSKT